MRLSARGISKGSALTETTVHAESGVVTIMPVEASRRPSVLGLVLSGRMQPDTGTVTIDGRSDAEALRRAVALVDAPDVSAPADELSLTDVLREELAFAGVRRTREAARRFLADEGLVEYHATTMGELPADVRVRVLAATAARIRGVTALVLVSPDRHGGEHRGWHDVAEEWARRGLAVIVLVGAATVGALAAALGGELDVHGQLHEDHRPPPDDDATKELPVAVPVSPTRVDATESDADSSEESER